MVILLVVGHHHQPVKLACLQMVFTMLVWIAEDLQNRLIWLEVVWRWILCDQVSWKITFWVKTIWANRLKNIPFLQFHLVGENYTLRRQIMCFSSAPCLFVYMFAVLRGVHHTNFRVNNQYQERNQTKCRHQYNYNINITNRGED